MTSFDILATHPRCSHWLSVLTMPTSPRLVDAIYICMELNLQVPSNLALHRVGARRWLSFLVIAWGIIASLFATLKVLPSYTFCSPLGCLHLLRPDADIPNCAHWMSLYMA